MSAVRGHPRSISRQSNGSMRLPRVLGLSVGEDFAIHISVVDTMPACDRQTDGQTDRRTDNSTVANTGLCIAITMVTPCENEIAESQVSHRSDANGRDSPSTLLKVVTYSSLQN